MPRAIYDWRTWENGKTHTLKYGEDFHLPTPRFAIQVYNRGKQKGTYPVTTTIDTFTLQVTFFKDREDAVAFSKTGGKIDQGGFCTVCNNLLQQFEIGAQLTECTGLESGAELRTYAMKNNGQFPKAHTETSR